MTAQSGPIERLLACVSFHTTSEGTVYGVRCFARGELAPRSGEISAGADFVQEWCNGDPAQTPEGAWALLDARGFASPADKVAALREFARIEGCDWARLMHLTLEQPDE